MHSGKLFAALAVLLTLALAPTALAQGPAPGGVTVTQGYGFATVAWGPVSGAAEYEIERTALPGGEPLIVGRWLPTRYSAQARAGGETTFADSGFVLGQSYRWRVRAIVAGTPGEWSLAVEGTTTAPIGPQAHLTPFERSGGATWTTHEEEVAWLHAADAASPRLKVDQIGTTRLGRPLLLATIGAPAPKSPKEIAEGNSVVIECTIHGGERAPREACMTLIRWLSFSDDPWAERILSQATVLVYPTANPDGQATGSRTNPTGQDLNRDHILIRHPETFAMAKVLRDHKPDMLIDGHELGSGPEIQWLWPRSPGVPRQLWELSQEHLTRGSMFDASALFGWSSGIWPTHRTDNWETLINNTAGLKNIVGQLEETPQQSGAARPNAPANSAANQQRRMYTHLWSFRQHLDYHHEHIERIKNAIRDAEERNSANDGPIYLDGARDVPVPPPSQEPSTKILTTPPCGYLLTAGQLQTRAASAPGDALEWTSATAAERLEAHGVRTVKVGSGLVRVPLGQPLRALIPYMLDPDLESTVRVEGLPNLSMVEGVRLADRSDTVLVAGTYTGVPNRVDAVSCSINDLIADELPWPSHGEFLVHVAEVADGLEAAGTITTAERDSIVSAAGVSTGGNVGGTVPATLSLTLGQPASFGPFMPGVDRVYEATTTANVITTAGDALLTVADPSTTSTGKLVNGMFSLASPLVASAASADGTAGAPAPVGGTTTPTPLLTYRGPSTNDRVTVTFSQTIGRTEALRTGTYGKTLTFTLSTTQP